MRELNCTEVACVSGGMQNAEDGNSSSTTSWWDNFVDALRSWWDRWPCGGGSDVTRSGYACDQLTDRDIDAAFYSIGGADVLAGKNGTPLSSSQIQDLGKSAVENIKKINSTHYPDPNEQ